MSQKCTCGGEIPPETLELHRALPKLYPVPLCDDCNRIEDEHTKEHNKVLEKEIEIGKRTARLETIPPEMRRTRENYPGFNSALWDTVRGWTPDRKWLGIVGEAGNSKTRCIALLAQHLIMAGHHVIWTTAVQFQHRIDTLRNGSSEEMGDAQRYLSLCLRCEILVMDDIGKNTWNASFERHFFDLIDTRKTHDRPVIWSANTHPTVMLHIGRQSDSGFAERMSEDRGAPLIGRLIEASGIIGLDGKKFKLKAA